MCFVVTSLANGLLKRHPSEDCFGVHASGVCCYTDAMAPPLLPANPPSTDHYPPTHPPTHPTTRPQLCGGYADAMARTAQLVEEECRVDFVDLNFGCPIDVVCRSELSSLACVSLVDWVCLAVGWLAVVWR